MWEGGKVGILGLVEVRKCLGEGQNVQSAAKVLSLTCLTENSNIHRLENVVGCRKCASYYRYTKCWLPLAGGNNARECVGAAPPLDVHWVWLVHMLAPQHYHKDCVAVTGRSVPHVLMTTKVSINKRLGL